MEMQGRAQRGRMILLPACFVAIIVGILGMHVLDRHVALPGHVEEHHGVTSPAASTTLAAHAAHASTPTEGLDSTAEALVSGSEGSLGDLMMLCGAMLLGAAASALAALRLRTSLAATGLRARHLPYANRCRATPVRAGTGPPQAWAFSVIRC